MGTRTSHRWYLRPLAALVVLLFEYLAISVAFDAAQLRQADNAFGGLGWTGLIGPAVATFGASLWMLGSEQIRAALKATPPIARSRLWTAVPVHLLCFAFFFVITAVIFSGTEPPHGSPKLWAGVWVVGGLLTLGSLVPLAFGTRRLLSLIRELSVPLLVSSVVAFLSIGAGLTTLSLWQQLNAVTLYSVAYILDLLVSPIYFVPAEVRIGTPDFWVQVAPICSGYEGIGLILVFVSAYIAVFHKRLRFPNALVLLPATIAVIWVLNVLRIVALILVGHFWSPQIALGGFHSKAGWIVFCSVALVAAWLGEHSPWFAKEPRAAAPNAKNPSAPYLLPLLAVVATGLVTGLFVHDFDYLYPGRVLTALLVLAWFRDDYLKDLREQLRGRPILSWSAIGIGTGVYVMWAVASWLTFDSLGTGPPEELAELSPPLSLAWVIARICGAVVMAPIVEELAFRGFLLRRVIASDFSKVPYYQWSWPAVLVSSLAFAFIHQQWVAGFLAGVLFAYAQRRRGLLSDAIIAHAVANLLLSAQVLFAGHWNLW